MYDFIKLTLQNRPFCEKKEKCYKKICMLLEFILSLQRRIRQSRYNVEI